MARQYFKQNNYDSFFITGGDIPQRPGDQHLHRSPALRLRRGAVGQLRNVVLLAAARWQPEVKESLEPLRTSSLT